MKSVGRFAFLTASTIAAVVFMPNVTWAQDAYFINCQSNVAYPLGSYCNPVELHEALHDWRNPSVAVAPAARASAAYAAGYNGSGYADPWHSPAPVVAPAAQASTAYAAGSYDSGYADPWHSPAPVIAPAARASTAYAAGYYGGGYAPYRSSGWSGAYAYSPGGGLGEPTSYASSSVQGPGEYTTYASRAGTLHDPYDGYPPRELYEHTYVPGSYYGPVCNPRFDQLCQ